MKKLILKLLGLDKLRKEHDLLKKQVDNMQHRVNNQSQSIAKIEDLVKIGVDHSTHGRDQSWAVICLPGRQRDHVEFIDLTGVDSNDLLHYLRQFKRENRTLDTPHFRLHKQLKHRF